MLNKLMAFMVVLPSVIFLVGGEASQKLEAVPAVELARYTGKWYEIARLPNRFQKNCVGEVTAAYSILADKQLKVINECRQKSGQMETAEGKARLAKPNGPNSKLEVRFAPSWLSWLPMVWGDYWILALAPDYSYSVVGTPDRKYLWVLSRTPQMDEAVYQQLIKQMATKGFDIERVVKTRQSN